ncbi:MAG: OmpH family outer membrane protein [bacterium]|nr:OmpH family outer membrane protein [bacterium]
MFHRHIFCLAVLLVTSVSAFSQNLKIGYANLELVLAYMPETKAMNETLKTFEKQLTEKLKIKERYMEAKFAEYSAAVETNPNDPQRAAMESELTKLQSEVQAFGGKAQEDLVIKRQELLQPIINKVDNALSAIQKEQGYDYILNTVDGNGVSIVLKGPDEHDLTKALMTKLGIQLPSGQ